MISENVQEELYQYDIRGKFLMFRIALLCINIQPIILGFIRLPCAGVQTESYLSTLRLSQK